MSTAEAAVNPNVPWWLVLIEGIALSILGLMLLFSPGITTIILVQFVGWYWLLTGVIKIVSIFFDRDGWGWKLAGGIIGILAGLMVVQTPLWSPFFVGSTLIIILGVQGLIFGVISLVQAFRGGGWGPGIMGAISMLFGFLFLTNIGGFTLSLPFAIGILAVFGGVTSVIAAFRLR
jgi:uncharacterized membrane protein HdeD (DUF308 family)